MEKYNTIVPTHEECSNKTVDKATYKLKLNKSKFIASLKSVQLQFMYTFNFPSPPNLMQ